MSPRASYLNLFLFALPLAAAATTALESTEISSILTSTDTASYPSSTGTDIIIPTASVPSNGTAVVTLTPIPTPITSNGTVVETSTKLSGDNSTDTNASSTKASSSSGSKTSATKTPVSPTKTGSSGSTGAASAVVVGKGVAWGVAGVVLLMALA